MYPKYLLANLQSISMNELLVLKVMTIFCNADYGSLSISQKFQRTISYCLKPSTTSLPFST